MYKSQHSLKKSGQDMKNGQIYVSLAVTFTLLKRKMHIKKTCFGLRKTKQINDMAIQIPFVTSSWLCHNIFESVN